MSFVFARPLMSAAAAAAILGAVAFASPVTAASTEPAPGAPAGAGAAQAQEPAPPAVVPEMTPRPKPGPGGHHARRSTANRVDVRIAELHSKLHVTDAQAPLWDAVAGVMRENAKTMDRLVAERAKHGGTTTALENIRSYQRIAEAHADGIGKLAAAFQALYESMPDDQKKNADAVFRARTAGRSR